MKLIDFFKKISSTNSTKEKEEILRTYKDQKEVLEILNYALDPYKNFYIKKMPERLSRVNDDLWSDKDRYKAFITLLDDLKSRHITGNKAKDIIQTVFRMFTDDEYDIYKKVLLKEAIGIGTTTVNKVIKNHIPEFKILLAPSQLPNLTDLQYPLYIQNKYDGFRAIYKDGQFYTRSGLIYTNNNLTKYFNCLTGIKDYVLDGELYIHNQPFQDLAKVLNSEESPIPSNLRYYVYDCLPIKDWDAQSTKIGYTDRLKLLRGIVNGTIGDYSKVIDAPTDKVDSAAEVVEIYKKALKNGYEGCMIRAIEGKYRWKRVTIKSGELIKLKPFKSDDLEIINVVEGEGKLKGTLGSIVVAIDPNTSCSVGSGFDDALRKEVWTNKDKFMGKIAEISYFEKTSDGSLRFPIFKRMRDDK